MFADSKCVGYVCAIPLLGNVCLEKSRKYLVNIRTIKLIIFFTSFLSFYSLFVVVAGCNDQDEIVDLTISNVFE